MILKNISKIIVTIAFLLLVGPADTLGYYTSEQSAQRITNQTALYTIDFYFGFQDEDVYIPVMTQRTEVNDPADKSVGYTFTTSENGDTTTGTSQALVLSDAEIIDGMYRIPAGHRGYFTLVAALTLDENDAKAKYGLQVTNLPFIKDRDGVTKEYGLGTAGLFAYQTKEVGLNK